jgi:hypothetical protein
MKTSPLGPLRIGRGFTVGKEAPHPLVDVPEVPTPKFDRTIPPSPKLKGALAIKLVAQRAAEAEADRPDRRQYGSMTVDLAPDSEVRKFESGAEGLTNATVRGLWHMSPGEVEEFTNEGGSDERSKYGPGTYVGNGELGGTQVELLQRQPHYSHELVVRGNVLAIPFPEQEDAAYEIADRAGVDDVAQRHLLNSVLREHEVEGVKYDAFFLYATKEVDGREMVEGVVLRPEEVLEVVNRAYVDPTAGER